ncbi:ribonuclease R [Paenibacillus thermoaerophilus]|uniref:Ribonuclease R n=1 Tax=Paenibacillus thermoaerophilus TaxID=1215385 RepID=A0ABW2V9J3_9BACL|nr:ribonuclease R [Paenibacillus thermoaerophilus]TMV08426.1 ribonuclease R [Paenibacillus thermoaerophilus]
MITEQQLLEFMREKAYKPMTYQELSQYFEAEDSESFREFLRMLNRLEERGEILRTRSDRYGVPERMNLIRGTLQVTAKGYGFLIPEDREQPDVYLHANDLNGAMHGDTILVRPVSRGIGGGRLEGEVVRVVKRKHTQLVGTFQSFDSYGLVLPDEKRIGRDIFIPKESFNGAVDGQKVVVRIVHYPEGRSSAEGEIIEILGHKNDPGVDILSIIRKYQLPEGFPEEVMAEAMAVPDEISPEDLKGRRDLRDKTIVTIDGEDAKDLDDAVCVEELPGGLLRLYVSIADVGYYVKEGSALDREAYERGCSVYLVDRVIPMLPHRLSNGICSLNPRVDRLTLTCEMTFDEDTRLVSHDIYPSVIRTVERMTYTNVRKVLTEEDPEVTERYAPLIEDFRRMERLAKRLRRRRMERGAIDFDFAEAKVIVDEQGKPVDIVKRERTIAESIIEEFMLAANETVAEHFHWLKVPFLYRIHEEPDGEKLMNFMQFIGNFGYTVRSKGNTVHPRALQKILEEIKGTREETVISTVMLRSMKQAKYDAVSLGHFGLAAEFYSHFTSPIRRYPDLVIHRIIREVLEHGALSEQRHEALAARMPDIARQSSERERIAAEAERDTEQMKKAEFMADKIGEEYEGIISSVTNFGIFVELPNTVNGMIRLSDLTDDYYHFHEQHHALIGERTSKVYRIGDEVRVRVVRVNMDEYTIDFELLEQKSRTEKVSLVDVAKGKRPGGEDREGVGRGGGRRGKGKGGTGGPHHRDRYPGGESGPYGGEGKKRRKGGKGGHPGAGKRGGKGGKPGGISAFVRKKKK